MELGKTTQKLPSVSIGMPVYNGANYIREALDSLLAQTFADFELIISDNASTDKTAQICKEYADRDNRIIYFTQYHNIGAVANFQFVLNSARSALFMWAAHDDKWSKNYLQNSTNILSDTSISFVFPTFELRSIRLHICTKFNNKLFQFIESIDKKERVLKFLELHHHSHKCNIVYALFRTDFIKSAHAIQNISNDGALGAVILSLGRGKMVNDAYFSKRYSLLWPGALSFIHAWYYSDYSNEFNLAKEAGIADLNALFPEYISEIRVINDRYKPFSHNKDFKILNTEDEFNNIASDL